MIESYLEKLNDEQRGPVLDTEGEVLVIAGAGSGKTRVLTTRIAYLAEEEGISPYRILAITFTNKAANEMKERLASMGVDVEAMWVCTIHSMCVRILRREGKRLGFDSNFSIYSEQDRERVIKRILSNAEVDEKDDKMYKKVRFHISNAKTQGLSPTRYAEENDGESGIAEICRYYALYEEELKKANSLDFDDLLVKTEYLLATYPEVRTAYADRFLYVHVDEFQDTNAVQYKIVKHLSSVHHNLFVVGDDDQSIYGWRGAEIENILGFPKDFPNAKVYKLERNYRSTKKILDLANCVIRGNTARNDKALWTENESGDDVEVYVAKDEGDEARFVAARIRQAIDRLGYSAKDFAVLMRINALSRPVEQEFNNYDIPYKVYGGFKFFERKEIKDLSAYLRAISNPLDNEAVLRVINVPKRGIGDSTVQALIAYATEQNLSVFDAIMDVGKFGTTKVEDGGVGLAPAAAKKVTAFYGLLHDLMLQCELLPLPEFVKAVMEKTDFNSQFPSDTEDDQNKRHNVGSYIGSVYDFCKLNPGATLADFLNSITLSADTDELGETGTVSLATVHAVKGLEFKVVFLIGLDENLFPLSRATLDNRELEEERRLLYVAVTRAEEKLFLSGAESRYLNGERKFYLRSQFVREAEPALSEKAAKALSAGSYSRTFGGYRSQSGAYPEGGYGKRGSYGGNPYGGSYGGGSYGRSGSYSGGGASYGSSGSYGGSYGSSGGTYASGGRTYNSERGEESLSGTARSDLYGKKPAPAPVGGAVKSASAAGKYTTGSRVKHPKFGVGTVIEEKNGVVTVAFQGAGIKVLSAAIAPLEKVD